MLGSEQFIFGAFAKQTLDVSVETTSGAFHSHHRKIRFDAQVFSFQLFYEEDNYNLLCTQENKAKTQTNQIRGAPARVALMMLPLDVSTCLLFQNAFSNFDPPIDSILFSHLGIRSILFVQSNSLLQ